MKILLRKTAITFLLLLFIFTAGCSSSVPAPNIPNKNDNSKKIESLKKEIEADPAIGQNYLELGLLLQKQEKWKESFDYLEKGLKADRGNSEMIRALADTAFAMKEPQKGINVIEKYISKTEKNPGLFMDLGRLFYQAGQFGKSSECLKEASALSPDDPSLYLLLGISQIEEGKKDEGIKTLEMGLRISEDSRNRRIAIMFEMLLQKARETDFRGDIFRKSSQNFMEKP